MGRVIGRDGALAEKIKSDPHWRVLVRPTVFEEERLPSLSECWQRAQACRVSLRGWDYPHVDHENRRNGTDYVESFVEYGRHRELWRLYQSGQFVHLFSFTEDQNREEAEKRAAADLRWFMPPGFAPSGYLSVVSALWTLTEVFEFAARLAEKGTLGDSAYVEVNMVGVRNRALFSWDQARSLDGLYVADEEELCKGWSLATTDLLGRSSEHALDAAEWFFERFGWMQPPRRVLVEDQKDLLEKRWR
jgi:hypothetical protein